MGTSICSRCHCISVYYHPHACGDKTLVRPSISRRLLSSPRVWGQACGSTTQMVSYRIIPTRVGTRLTNDIVNSDRRDHPHACGDKLMRSENYAKAQRSSPRVWGQGSKMRSGSPLQRIIPTRVGTSM